MEISAWTPKEKYLSAFWLLCAITLVATTYIQKNEMTAGAITQQLGFVALIASWALGPSFFLQPFSLNINKPVQKPLLFGLAVFFACQLASLLIRFAAQAPID